MSDRIRVKICGITRQADAELALELGVDALGFILEPTSPRSILDNPESLAIPSRLGPYTICAAVLGRYRPAPAGFNLIQSVDLAPVSELRPALRAIRVRPEDTVESILDLIGDLPAALLDGFDPNQYGGTGRRVDWALAAEVVARTGARIVLAGGLNPDNVAAAIATVRPYAVDVASGVEASPGIKDAGKLRAFVQAAMSGKIAGTLKGEQSTFPPGFNS